MNKSQKIAIKNLYKMGWKIWVPGMAAQMTKGDGMPKDTVSPHTLFRRCMLQLAKLGVVKINEINNYTYSPFIYINYKFLSKKFIVYFDNYRDSSAHSGTYDFMNDPGQYIDPKNLFSIDNSSLKQYEMARILKDED